MSVLVQLALGPPGQGGSGQQTLHNFTGKRTRRNSFEAQIVCNKNQLFDGRRGQPSKTDDQLNADDLTKDARDETVTTPKTKSAKQGDIDATCEAQLVSVLVHVVPRCNPLKRGFEAPRRQQPRSRNPRSGWSKSITGGHNVADAHPPGPRLSTPQNSHSTTENLW